MDSDPKDRPSNGGEEGGMSNLLALATVSEVFLMNNNCKHDSNSNDVAVAGSTSPCNINNSNATSGGIRALEGVTLDVFPLEKNCAARSQCDAATEDSIAFAAARANDLQGNCSLPVAVAPNPKEESGVRSQTNTQLSQKTSAPPKKRTKQCSHKRAQQTLLQRESDVMKKKNKPSFPVILMAIMSGSQNREYITFLSDEQRFIIIDSVSLEAKVLPIHFEVNAPTYDQFLQLLDLWGFEVLKDPNYPFVKVFKHPMFRKGDWEGCLQIQLPGASNRMQVSEKGQTAVTSRRKNYIPSLSLSLIPNVSVEEVSTRSVTPPKASSSSDLFDRLASAQTEMGQLLSSLPTNNFMYRRVTYDPTPDEATAMFQQKLRECLLLGRNQGRMGDSELKTSTNSMPMFHRRASLNDMDARVAEHMQFNGNVCLPMNYRRPSLGNSGDMSLAYVNTQQLQKFHQDKIMIPSSSSDADVRSATQDIVSAAIDVLRPKRRRITVDCLPSSGSSVCLDVMTEIFLERSRKVLSSRPVLMMGTRSTIMHGNIDITTTDNNKKS